VTWQIGDGQIESKYQTTSSSTTPYKKIIERLDRFESVRAKLEALKTLSFGHLFRFQFAGMSMARLR